MQPFQSEHKQLLKQILEPLFQDFQYWFSRSQSLLESERMPFLSIEEQNQLLQRIKDSLEQVKASEMLFRITDGETSLDTEVLKPWHELLMICWRISNQWHSLKN